MVRTRRRPTSRLLRRTRNWLRYGQKEIVYPNHFFAQLAVCAVLFLAICGLKSMDSEPVQAALADIRQAASDIYTIQKDGKDILFPAVSGVVKEVDLEGGRIIVDKKRFFEVAVL